jgi:hypothetical protein
MVGPDKAPIEAPSHLLIRWLTSEQMRSLIENDRIRPSWKHFLPSLGKFRNGICFDMMTTSHWRADHKRIGIVIESTDLPQHVKAHAIEGHKVYTLSESLQWAFDPVKRREDIAQAKKNMDFYSARPDEMFVLGTIDDLGRRLKGIVVIDPAKKLGPKVSVELQEFSKSNRIPVATLTAEEFGNLRSNHSVMRQCFDAKLGAMAVQHAHAKQARP